MRQRIMRSTKVVFVRFEVAGYTQCGPVRTSNQDSYVAKLAHCAANDCALLVVADGVGGASFGELASAVAVRAFATWFNKQAKPIVCAYACNVQAAKEALRAEWTGMIAHIHAQLLCYGLEHSCTLGTTLTAVFVWENRYFCAQVGDSRAALITQEKVHWITRDQCVEDSFVNAPNSPVRPQKLLTQALGMSPHIEPDFYDSVLPEAAQLLVCSDGFCRMSSDEELAALLNAAAHDHQSQTECIQMIAAMLEHRGEKDNTTAVLLRVAEVLE